MKRLHAFADRCGWVRWRTFVASVSICGLILLCLHSAAFAQDTNGLSLAVSGLSAPSGLALGPGGNLFVSDLGAGSVYRIESGGVVALEANGFASPRDVVLDGAGNMYVADAARGVVYRLSSGGQTTILANNLAAPCCLGFDANGNLLVSHELSANDALSSQYPGAITRIASDGHQTLLATGFLNPEGLLVDQSGNILVSAEGYADDKNVFGSGIFKIDELAQVTELVDMGSLRPGGLALSSQGTLFFAGLTPTEGTVFVSGSGTFEPFVTGFQQPRALATDQSALYVADQQAGKIWRVSLGPTTTAAGQAGGGSAVQTSASQTAAIQPTASPQRYEPGVDPVIAREFEKMWGYHGKPDYSKIPVTAPGKPQAPAGVTCVIGQVVDDNWWAIPNVTVRLGHKAIRTNSSGWWMLTDVPAGYQVYMIDGRSADWGSTHYPVALVEWQLYAGQPNVLPYAAYLPALDTAHTTYINPDRETVHTTPLIPGMEIQVPAHTTITSVDGLPVTSITTTLVPAGKPIYPMPLVDDPGNHITIQPGGSVCSKNIHVVYSNPAKFAPGYHTELWEYAALTHGGWYQYGSGTVSSNGFQILPDNHAGFNVFGCGMTNPSNGPPDSCSEGCDCGGDPVTLATGVFTEKATDFAIPGLMPINFQRIYRNQEVYSNPFDFGWSVHHSYEYRLYGQPYSPTNQAFLSLRFPDDTSYQFNYVTNSPVQTYTCTNDYRVAGATIYQIYYPNNNGPYPTTAGFNYFVVMKDGTKYDFDGKGYLRAIRDPNNNTLSINRGSSPGGQLLSITQPSGRGITFTYNNGSISQATDSAGRTISYAYDSSGRLAAVTNIIGGVTRYVYDGSNNMTSVILPNGIVKMTNYFDSSNRVTNQIVADGGVYQFFYATNSLGQITGATLIKPQGNTSTTSFDASHMATNRIDSTGFTNLLVRNSQNEATTTTIDPLGRTNGFVYDANYNVTAMTNAQGKVTTYTYSTSYNRLTSMTDPLGHTTSYGYDVYGNLTSMTNALGKLTTYVNNQFGQRTSMTDPLGNTSTYTYNASFDPASVTDPLGNTIRYVLDALGRRIGLIDALGRTTQITYSDLMGSGGGCSCSGRSAVDLPASITDPNGGVTSFGYDAVGNRTNVTDALSHTVSYGYDGLNRLTSRTDQLGKIETYTYDKNGNETNYVDRRGISNSFYYDADNRRTGVVYAAGDNIAYFLDAVGRTTNVVDSIAGSTQSTYDTLDRLTQVLDINGTITYSYNDVSLRTNMTVAGQNAVAYLYDPANRLTNVVQGTFSTSLAYDDDGRRTNLALPNGINVVSLYDPDSRQTNMTYLAAVTNQIAYGYDQLGDRVSQASALSQYNLPSAISTSSYDAANHQLLFGSYTNLYDAEGNLTNMVSGVITNQLLWSARNKLTNMLGAVTATFLYDGKGRRITRSVAGTTEKYLYDGRDVIQQLNNTGTVAANYLRGLRVDEPWQRIDIGVANTNRIYLADGLGSIIALTDTNTIIDTQYAYDPFGNTAASGLGNKNGYQFTSRENDGTGLYYYRARYYDAALGRFASEDRMPFRNLYAYAGGNPLRFADPLGLRPCSKEKCHQDCDKAETGCELLCALCALAPPPIDLECAFECLEACEVGSVVCHGRCGACDCP